MGLRQSFSAQLLSHNRHLPKSGVWAFLDAAAKGLPGFGSAL